MQDYIDLSHSRWFHMPSMRAMYGVHPDGPWSSGTPWMDAYSKRMIQRVSNGGVFGFFCADELIIDSDELLAHQ